MVPLSSATATPRPTHIPSPTVTSTPEPSTLLEIAQSAIFNGDWDTAIQNFQAVLSISTDFEELGSAALGLGKTYFQAARDLEAIEAFDLYIKSFEGHSLIADARFLRAESYRNLGNDEAAIDEYKIYLQLRPGVLDFHIEQEIGDALRRLGRPSESIAHYGRAAEAPSLGGGIALRIKIGMAYSESGDFSTAVEIFDDVYQLTQNPGTKASMNLLAGRAHVALGNFEAAYARYQDSVTRFPTQAGTYEGLITLVNAGVEVDDFQRGFVDYHADAFEPAIAAFNRALLSNPSAAAMFYRGLAKRELGDAFGALIDFQQVIEIFVNDVLWSTAWIEKADTEWAYLDDFPSAIRTLSDFVNAAPSNPEAPEALSTAARLYERSAMLDEAASQWIRVAEQYPNSPLAFRSAFLSGITRYRLTETASARDAFLFADALSTHPADRAAARLWIGKTYQAEGNAAEALQAWLSAAEADPTGYYSLRAAELISGDSPFLTVDLDSLETDWLFEQQQAEVWLREVFSIQEQGSLADLAPELASDHRLQRGVEYWRLGLYSESKREFESIRKSAALDVIATYSLTLRLLELGLYQPAIFASRQILDLAGMDDAETLNAPLFFNHIRFGTYFDDLIFPEADRYDLDKLFVLSVVRQESLFEGFITSFANARGLMQVIPPTGQEIAAKLGWPTGYNAEDLYRPLVSVRFGTNYLDEQRDRFDGDLFAVLAAYNAGPGNTIAWKELAPNDPDLFLEILRLNQPRNYIRSIFEFYALYQFFYTDS